MKKHFSKKFKLFKRRTFLEVLASICVNLTSGWFGVLVIAPGFLNAPSLDEYLKLLPVYLIFGIIGFVISLILTEKSKTL